MEARAELKYARVSAKKAKNVVDLIRYKRADEALDILRYTPNKTARLLEKLIKSAIANAQNNHGMDRDNLYISEIYANQGPTLKRIMPRAQGRADRIRKRTSHLKVVLKEIE